LVGTDPLPMIARWRADASIRPEISSTESGGSGCQSSSLTCARAKDKKNLGASSPYGRTLLGIIYRCSQFFICCAVLPFYGLIDGKKGAGWKKHFVLGAGRGSRRGDIRFVFPENRGRNRPQFYFPCPIRSLIAYLCSHGPQGVTMGL